MPTGPPSDDRIASALGAVAVRKRPARQTRLPAPKHAKGHAGVDSIDMEGRTDATMKVTSAKTQKEKRTRGTGCDDCEPGQCVHLSGTVKTRYATRTSVRLPSVNDYPDLTRCQRDRVQRAIRTELAPHEQEHVKAFRSYAGTTNRPFQLTACATDIEAQRDELVKQMVDEEHTDRESSAQAKSDALDPFIVNVDLDCTDAPRRGGRRR